MFSPGNVAAAKLYAFIEGTDEAEATEAAEAAAAEAAAAAQEQEQERANHSEHILLVAQERSKRRSMFASSSASHHSMFIEGTAGVAITIEPDEAASAPASPAQAAAEGEEALLAAQERANHAEQILLAAQERAKRRSMFASSSASHRGMFLAPREDREGKVQRVGPDFGPNAGLSALIGVSSQITGPTCELWANPVDVRLRGSRRGEPRRGSCRAAALEDRGRRSLRRLVR